VTNYQSALGVDIDPSGLKDLNRLYSIALVKGEEVVFTAEKITYKELLRYTRKFKPDILATDNVFELAKDEIEIKKLAFLLPDKTILVQVTGNPSNPLDTLVNIAKTKGIEVSNKLSPIETAILAAKLALKGEGYKIKLREDETFILVTKATEPSAGGMSLNRYKRRIYTNILHAISHIKSILTSNNFLFDFFPSKHSNEGGIFIVQAQREIVKRYIKPYEGYGIRIRILPVVRNRIITKEEIRNISRPLIVGYDPGITVGICAMDLKGNILLLESLRYAGLDEIREKIARIGNPVIIATDKATISAMINKLAATFNAEIWKPQRDLSIEEKKSIARDFIEEIKYEEIKLDTHKRDSLAAAILAFRKYYPIYQSIERELKERNIEHINPQTVFEKVIKTKRNIKEIINEIKEMSEKSEEVILQEPKQEVWKNEVDKIKKQLEETKRLLKALQSIIDEKNQKISELSEKIERLKNEERLKIKASNEIVVLKQKVDALTEENKRLLKEIEKHKEELNNIYKAFEMLYMNKAEILKKESIEEIQESNNKDIRCFDSIPRLEVKELNLLIKSKLKAIIYRDKADEFSLNYLEKNDIFVIKLDELPYIEIDKFIIVDKAALQNLITLKKKARKEVNKEEREKIAKLFEEYRKLKI
jgi:predicted RNase H-like nuclease (RuvC/YqgF family)